MSMTMTINHEQRLFVIPAGDGYSCLGFDVLFARLKQIVEYLGLKDQWGLPWEVNESEKGTAGQYAMYRKAVDEASRREIRETWFDPGTVLKVQEVLERYRESGKTIRLFYGDPETGHDWMEENDVMGRIGRTGGIFKSPILVEKGEFGGPAILTASIIRIMDAETGRELYRHPRYLSPEMEVRSTEGILASWHSKKPPKLLSDMGYTHGVWVKNDKGEFENQANFKSFGKACQYVAFMTGDSMRKPS